MQVVLLRSAEQDIKETYILKNFSKDSWQTIYQKIQESINTIQRFPQSGKIPQNVDGIS